MIRVTWTTIAHLHLREVSLFDRLDYDELRNRSLASDFGTVDPRFFTARMRVALFNLGQIWCDNMQMSAYEMLRDKHEESIRATIMV